MRKLKVPGRIIGRKAAYNFDFHNPDTDLPLGMAQPAKFTKAFGWLREVTALEALTNLLRLNKRTQAEDIDVDGRDRSGMLVKPQEAPEEQIRKALLEYLLGNPCHCCSDKCLSAHKCRCDHLPKEYWQGRGWSNS